MKPKLHKKIFYVLAGLLVFLSPDSSCAAEELLDISTPAKVSESGEVEITLILKNNWRKPLYQVQPVLHFHHSMHRMPLIKKLEPGETVAKATSKHPPVLRVGRYPVMAVVHYRKSAEHENSISQIHADSFYFREPVESAVEGEIVSEENSETSLLKILLRNNSPSLKNVRVMLLLPPELMSRSFKGMVGFTMRPGEKKYFEIPVEKHKGKPGRNYPVNLMVEYAEMMKHYTGVIPGNVSFTPTWADVEKWPQALVFVFLLATVIWFFRPKEKPVSVQGDSH